MGANSAIILRPKSHRRGSGAGGGSGPDEAAVSSGVLMAMVNAQGTLDARRVEAFAAEVANALDAGATRLLVDLSRADDVAAAYQNTLLAARQRLFGRGRIAVVLSPAMRRRFGVLGLDRRFLLAKDRMHAVRLLGLADAAPPRTHAPRPHAHAA